MFRPFFSEFAGSDRRRWFRSALRTDDFIPVNQPSREAVEFMSALRVWALEGMKQLVKKTEHDLLPQWLGSDSL